MRKILWAGLPVFLLSLLLAACGAATATTLPVLATIAPAPSISSTTTLAKDDVSYIFEEQVPTKERETIQKGLELGIKSFGKAEPVQIVAKDKFDFAYRKVDTGILGWADAGQIVVFTNDETGKRPSESRLIVTMLHEYYHNVQFSLAGVSLLDLTTESKNIAPVWLVEGSAEYLAYRTAADNNYLSFDTIQRQKQREAIRMSMPMTSIERTSQIYEDAPYSVGFLAVGYLLNKHGGQTALTKYWQNLKDSAKWQDAFQKSFGLDVTKFYAEFEPYRRNLVLGK